MTDTLTDLLHDPLTHILSLADTPALLFSLSLPGDIVCLQEVQSDHYEQHLNPFMQTLGYEGIFKQKSRESMGVYGKVRKRKSVSVRERDFYLCAVHYLSYLLFIILLPTITSTPNSIFHFFNYLYTFRIIPLPSFLFLSPPIPCTRSMAV